MAKDVKELSDSELDKKLKGARVAAERATGGLKKLFDKKVKNFEAELERRASEGEADVKAAAKDVKKEVKKVEKKAKKEAKKYWLALDSLGKEYGVFIAKDEEEADDYLISNFDIDERDLKEITKAQYDKWRKDNYEAGGDSPKPKSKLKAAPKKAPKKRPRTYASPTEKFELVIDGKTFKFDDLKSKQECERAKKAVEARYKETKAHKSATKEGIARSRTVSVTQRITDGFASIAKKAVAEVPTTKIQKKPSEIASELAEVEKAFDLLFDKLGALMNKQIPKTQRKQIMDILTKFENKVEKGSDKKTAATSKTKKEDGGLAGFTGGGDDSWSYASFL
jgi:hypothetical protein